MGRSCPSPPCLSITQRGPSRAEGKADPRPRAGLRFCGWGSLSGPFLRTLLSILILLLHEHLLSELFSGDAMPVIVNHNEQAHPCLSISLSNMKNCDTNRYEKSLAVISVVTEYRKSLNKYPCSKYALWSLE